MSDNLNLWRTVERTDPDHVKPITGKSYKGNSPKPHFLIFKATETFGPCGLGWGFDIVEEKLLDGALIAPGFNERIHMARVRVWYKWSGKRGHVEHVGQTAFCGKRASGQTYTDEDAPKKSVTDALIKALSMIGFAGDIFMGRYDDNKYAQNLKRELAEEAKAAEKPAELPDDEDAARDEYLKSCIAFIGKASDPIKLRDWWASDEQRQARRDFSLNQDEVDHLKTAFGDRLKVIATPFDDDAPRANGHSHVNGRQRPREGARAQ